MNQKAGINLRNTSRVNQYLMKLLLPLPGGARLPGIRTIMEQTGTGQIIVSRVLRKLEKDGFIRIEPCRGIFRNKPSDNPHEIRLLNFFKNINLNTRTTFFSILYGNLIERAKADGWEVTMENVSGRQPAELADELVSGGISRCFIVGAVIPDFAECLKKRMQVCLELLPRHPRTVTVELRDRPGMIELQLNYLFQRGYRRIGYLYTGCVDTLLYPVHVLRLMDFYRIMAEKRMLLDPDWVFICSERYENIYAGLERIMNSKPPPEALIVPGIGLRAVYSFCRRHKIRIGKDLAVFACDNIHEKLVPEPTVITNNPGDIAETFWQMFLAAERGEKVESRCTELLILTGQTVPNLKTRIGT